jgi:hypothetical protein
LLVLISTEPCRNASGAANQTAERSNLGVAIMGSLFLVVMAVGFAYLLTWSVVRQARIFVLAAALIAGVAAQSLLVGNAQAMPPPSCPFDVCNPGP